LQKKDHGYFKSIWHGLIRKSGEPVIRKAVREAMKLLSEHFVLGRNIEEALKNSKTQNERGYTFSYDMLGEVARTQADADRYFAAYVHAIKALGSSHQADNIHQAPSISVKLSALHPRYDYVKREDVVPVLIARVKELALLAKQQRISMTIDAEEADRLEMSLDIFAGLFTDQALAGWEGLGLAIQAYQKRTVLLINWLIELSRSQKRRIPVRLVKGAYWDSEIKMTQMLGLDNYPVFTRKVSTDISYIACAKKMLTAQDAIYPQFATHNAYSAAAILTLMNEDKGYQNYHFEFQNLQGMGKALHNYVVDQLKLPCRIYAPVGSHEDLLPYLVRRLLENGANSSFVNRIADKKTPLSALIVSPIAKIKSMAQIPNPNIPLPKGIFGASRVNSSGLDLSNTAVCEKLADEIRLAAAKTWQASPFNREVVNGHPVFDPANNQQQIGSIEEISAEAINTAVQKAAQAYTAWDARGQQARAEILRKMADLIEKHRADLMYLIMREGGRTLLNTISEVREATDFCRYYAEQTEKHLTPETLLGYTGERDVLRTHGRGVILCISPWNFPVAIFTGQIAAALVTGNTVLAKPAMQTPLTAALIVKLFHEAGVPQEVLQLMLGRGSVVGPTLLQNPLINGVLFTGSDATAKSIQQALAARPGIIAPLVAETGGMNAMIADSSALPEQLVRDVILSAFDSAGQRCSALRILFVQNDIADDVIRMLAGAMAELTVGDPMLLSTDVGPVIDRAALQTLQAHEEFMTQNAKLIYKVKLPAETAAGTFIAPQAYELPNLNLLTQEVFGPILHVIRYRREDLDQVIDAINHLGYGLTFGIQSRIDETVDYIQSRIKAGNIYVNRNIIGAVVGVQPFGGRGLSGTGPKAGGPHYLAALCTESTLSIDTTAAGGNASLMAMDD
jgi:RHH-type proline utilization regulon transcriptional repressor/proline dehydrogenase/delta 1-pyrroline-5-carboxylate dehydrogenase